MFLASLFLFWTLKLKLLMRYSSTPNRVYHICWYGDTASSNFFNDRWFWMILMETIQLSDWFFFMFLIWAKTTFRNWLPMAQKNSKTYTLERISNSFADKFGKIKSLSRLGKISKLANPILYFGTNSSISCLL